MATLPGTPKTWTAGSVLTAADLNAEVRDSMSFLSDKPRARVKISDVGGNAAGFTIATGTWTSVEFDAEVYDTDTLHDNSTNNTRITLARAGLWIVSGNIQYESNSTGYRQSRIALNGSSTIASNNVTAINGAVTNVNVSTQWYVSGTTDYVELDGWQNSGGGLDIQPTQGTWFAAVWVGE